jgi:cytochrome c553
MAQNHHSFERDNPWPRIGWLSLAALVGIAAALALLVLDRYQLNDPALGLWNAICRGLGIIADNGPARGPAPPLRTPSRIAWTSSTLEQVRAGNVAHGQFIALNCAACHGEGGVSTSTLIPTLAGMDAAVTYKQLDDYRSGKRLWGVMTAMAKTLSAQDSADVASFFAGRPNGLAASESGAGPRPESGSRVRDSAEHLAFVGDAQRGLAPCAACHGSSGFKLGAPPLSGQHADYIERQLAAFAQDLRQNDINQQMRTIAKQLTQDEMHAIAAFYGAPRTSRIAKE